MNIDCIYCRILQEQNLKESDDYVKKMILTNIDVLHLYN
jgi:hypothetical protein